MTIFKFVLPVLVLFSIQSSSNYSNSTYDYSFELAKGWKVIPQEDFKNSLTRAGLDKDAFVEGFYKYPKKYFEFPYMMTNFLEKNGATFADMKKYLTSRVLKDVMKDAAEKHGITINELNVGTLYFDEPKKNAYVKMDTKMAGYKNTIGITVFHLTTKGFLGVYFYTTPEEYTSDIPDFNVVINSLNTSNK